MTLTSGTKLGPYEIQSQLGAGDMGEVYKARDNRLDRTVAIKVLPPHLSDDPELRQRFEGQSQASLISAIMSSEPKAMSELQPMTPPALEHVVKRCLAKDPEERWQSALDVGLQLKWIAEGGAGPEVAPQAQSDRWRLERFIWIAITAVLAAITIIAVTRRFDRVPGNASIVHFDIELPDGAFLSEGLVSSIPVISPDGRHLAFSAYNESGQELIWVHDLENTETTPLAGTEGPSNYFWSPDGQAIGFIGGESQLRRIDLATGSARTICNDAVVGGGTWNRDGVVIFVHSTRSLYMVSAAGGEPSCLVPLDEARQDFSLVNPQFLPDGRHFLFHARSADTTKTGTYVGSLDSPETRRVLSHDALTRFAHPGHLLFVQERTLFAQPFDVKNLVTTDDPVSVVAPVGVQRARGCFFVSETGVLAYRPPSESRLLWFDRQGSQIGLIATPEVSRNPELSRDGTRLSFEVIEPGTGTRDIWMTDLSRNITSRLTPPRLGGSDPVWSPDDNRIAFTSARQGIPQLHVIEFKAPGEPERVIESQTCMDYPNSWSPDGRYILLERYCPGTSADLWLVSVSEDTQAEEFITSVFNESAAQFSPDGQLVSYNSNKSGRFEIYVQSFPSGEDEVQVSDGGGFDARWRGDGKELFYLSPDRKMMSVQISRDGSGFTCSRPQPLFQTNATGPFAGGLRFNYAVSSDGQRFLINTDTGGPESKAIHVILNWPALLER